MLFGVLVKKEEGSMFGGEGCGVWDINVVLQQG